MRILQVVPYFYPAWAYGGPAKLVYDTSSYFAQQGHQVVVFTSDAYDDDSRMPAKLRLKPSDNLRVYYFRNIFNRLTSKYNIFCCPELFLTALWEVPRADVIHLHDFYTPHNLWIAFLAKLWHKPYVLSVHGCLESARVAQRSLFKRLFLLLGGRWLLTNASLAMATSENEVKAYEDYGVHRSRISLLGHGVRTEEFQSKLTKAAARKSWKLPSENIVITFLGRIHKIKGLDLLVKADSQLKGNKISIVIAGSDDGYLAELKALIKELKLKNVRLTGTCFGERKADLFKATDVFVYPSYSEGFSLGILEAGAAGLPLVITTGCHFNDVAKSKSGLVVKPEVSALVEGLQKMIDEPKLRAESAINVRHLIETKYSMSGIGDRLLKHYRKVSGKK